MNNPVQSLLIDEYDFPHQIEQILKDFNFVRLEQAMLAVEWKWYMGRYYERDHYIVPTVAILKQKAREYLEAVAKKEKGSCGSGGFEATNDGVQLTLRFTFAEQEGYVPRYSPHDDELLTFVGES